MWKLEKKSKFIDLIMSLPDGGVCISESIFKKQNPLWLVI